MPLTPTMLLMPERHPALVGGEGVGDDRRRVGQQAGAADALDDAEDDQVHRARRAGHPVDRQQQRGDGVDDEAEVVDLHAAVHVAEPAEADDQHAGDDQVAEDHPQQVEAVGRHQRIELDAAEDVGHRDQRDRGVERRQQDAERRVGERDPLVAILRGASLDRNTQATCAVCLSISRYGRAHDDRVDRARSPASCAWSLGQLIRRLRAESTASARPGLGARPARPRRPAEHQRPGGRRAGAPAVDGPDGRRARGHAASSPAAPTPTTAAAAFLHADPRAAGPPSRPSAARRVGWLAHALADALTADERAVLPAAAPLLRRLAET